MGGSRAGSSRPGLGARAARGAAALTAVVLALSGCVPMLGTPSRTPSAGPEDPVQDQVTQRWYAPIDVTEDPTAIQAQFPQLDEISGISVDGRITDPYERVPIPVPDDYWWQAVIVIGTDQVAELSAAAAAAGSSYGVDEEVLTGEGTSTMNEPAGTRADDSVIRGALMAPLEEQAGSCEGGWILLGDLFHAEDVPSPPARTADHLMITMAAVCEGGDRVVVDTMRF